MKECFECGNPYLAIRKDIYKDGREFVYCDVCGFLIQTDSILLSKIEAFERMLYPRFSEVQTVPMLYEAFNRLPACNLMAVIGAAIQDLQYHQQELTKKTEDLNKVVDVLRRYDGSCARTLWDEDLMPSTDWEDLRRRTLLEIK